jgi:hypothetical protein
MDSEEPNDAAENPVAAGDEQRYRYEFPSSATDSSDHYGTFNTAHGGTILTLGVLSLFCCGVIIGPIAWYWGNASLRAIADGWADPAETSCVVAGRALGIIATLGHILFLCVVILTHIYGDPAAPYYQYLPYQNFPWRS